LELEDSKSEQLLIAITELMESGVSFLDACIHYADTYDIEIEIIGEIIRRSQVLAAKAREDAESLRLVEKMHRLPV